MKTRILLVILFVLGAIIASACATPSPTPAPPVAPTTANATAAPAPTIAPTATQVALKGELSLLCTPQPEWCEGMKKEFEARYPGVTVNYVRLSSGESLTRLRNEKRIRNSISGGADLLILSSPRRRKDCSSRTNLPHMRTSSIPN